MMRLSVAEFSARGGRETNEDYVGFCANDAIGCFALADGVGGHEGGALASQIVVQQVLKTFSELPRVHAETIRATVTVAREALAQARLSNPDFVHMNTTLATLMLDASQALAYWMHLGDSRIYLFRNGRARVLTTDHSILQSMIDAGLAKGDVRGEVERSTLYASVGSAEVPQNAVCQAPLALQDGDVFLLCSDGFWESVNEQMMESLLQVAENEQQWICHMVSQIRNPHAPEQDNFSAVAVWIGNQEGTTRIQTLSLAT